MKKGAILISRQKLLSCRSDRWVKQLIRAVDYFKSNNIRIGDVVGDYIHSDFFF